MPPDWPYLSVCMNGRGVICSPLERLGGDARSVEHAEISGMQTHMTELAYARLMWTKISPLPLDLKARSGALDGSQFRKGKVIIVFRYLT